MRSMLRLLCSADSPPRIPDGGQLMAVAEKVRLVNSFILDGFKPPLKFTLDAVNLWVQGKRDFQVRPR